MSQMKILVEASNGSVVPLYFDRQVVRAEDLMLDRSSHDDELARMRRLLHGWGVVAGLIPVLAGDGVMVTPGYGMTPRGRELFLDAPLVLDRIAARVVACCGPGDRGCELAEDDEPEDIDADVTAWLAAWPVARETDLRAGTPTGCAHPAMQLAPARRCDGVALGLLCSLPERHAPPQRSCAELHDLVCGDEQAAPITLPPPPQPEDELLVLARLTVSPDGETELALDDRRRLLPAGVLQDWLMACVCAALDRESDPRDPDEEEETPWVDLVEILRDNGYLRFTDTQERPDPRLHQLMLDDRTRRELEGSGIVGPKAFVAADPDVVAQVTGRSADEVRRAQRDMRNLAVFYRARRPRRG